ncbi:MAG: alpha/beta fold hydrolase [Caulobacteraceae bacterium]
MAAFEFGPAERAVDLIFLHANGFNALTYRAILAPLAARRRILAIDQRGHGGTTLAAHAAGRANWHDFRDDLLALLAVLGIEGVVLAGHSMGGTASLLAAAEAPERIARLVLLEPVILPPGPPMAAGEASVLHASLIERAQRRRRVFPDRAAALDGYLGRGAFASWPAGMVADFVAGGFRDLPGGGWGWPAIRPGRRPATPRTATIRGTPSAGLPARFVSCEPSMAPPAGWTATSTN